MDGRQATEQLVADLMRCGYRSREAWRLACELTQDEVAARFNQARGDPKVRMRGSRICEYEKWPIGGVRPSVRILKILAAIYETSWDRLIDIDDLEVMPAHERQAFLDVSELRYGNPLDSLLPRQGLIAPVLCEPVMAHRGTVALADDLLRQAGLMCRRDVRVSSPRSRFAGFRFPPAVIIVAVRWYLRYGLSYREVEELLTERDIAVDHVTIYRWLQRFTPLLIERHDPADMHPGIAASSTRRM